MALNLRPDFPLVSEPDPLIVMRGLSREFLRVGQEPLVVLDEVNLTIRSGEFVAITGPSGSGKSTLMYIMGCLDQSSGGEYLWHGQHIHQMTPKQLAYLRNHDFGFIFQSFHLLPRLVAWENVALPLIYSGVSRKQRKERACELLDRIGLGDRLEHFPSQLSGGQQQRVAIARALINQPTLILADEPTGNLDSRTSVEIMELLRNLNDQGATLVMVTHDGSLAAMAHRQVEVIDGRIARDVLLKGIPD